jgi:DegV family protein with EDD domain
MRKIAIITDSGCDLPAAYTNQHENLYILPLGISFSDQEYRAGIDITTEQVVERMEAGETPKTSLPHPGALYTVFEDLERRGITQAVFVMMSGALSGTLNMVRLACQQREGLKSLIFDSKILSMSLGYMVMNAIELVNAGTPFEKIEAALIRLRENVDGMFFLPSLDHLIAGGRIGRVAGAVGKLLNIRPVIGCDETGAYYARATTVGARRTVQVVKRMVSDFAAGRGTELSIMHAGALGEAKKLLEELRGLPCILSTQILPLGPALAAHVGRGMLAVCTRSQPVP